MLPSEPRVTIELERGHGYSTRIEDRGDGTEDVVSLYRGRELERYTRQSPDRSRPPRSVP